MCGGASGFFGLSAKAFNRKERKEAQKDLVREFLPEAWDFLCGLRHPFASFAVKCFLVQRGSRRGQEFPSTISEL
jgi:hypothetical protein